MKKSLVFLPAINVIIALYLIVIGRQQPDAISPIFYGLAAVIALPALICLNQHRVMLKIARFFLFSGALLTALFAIFCLAGFLNITRVPGASLVNALLYTILCVYLLGFKGYLNVYEEELFSDEGNTEARDKND